MVALRPIKLGVVGLGALGELHVSNLRYRVPAALVTAVCDIRPDRVKAVQAQYDIPTGYTDFDEMIAAADLDAVVIATNVSAHEVQCICAVQAGRHVFCEKPLAPSVEACRHIEQAVERHPGIIFTIGYMRRFDPAYAEAMKRVRAGEIGDVIMFKGFSLDPSSVLPQHLAGVQKGLYTPFLCEMGIHDADLAGWFLNSEMVSVYAVGGAYVVPEFADFHDYDFI